MNENHLNVRFEYTLDEAVAFQVDYLKATKEGASWRKREQLMFLVALLTVVVLLGWLSSDRSPATVAGLVGITLVGAPIATVLFGSYYDHVVKRRLRRVMTEQLGGPGPYTCAIEIRPDSLWVSQPRVQLAFPWRDAKKVEDATEGVIVTFAGGRVLARTRGFTSLEHRADFVAGLRERVSEASPGGTVA
jgi:hypothetical protein